MKTIVYLLHPRNCPCHLCFIWMGCQGTQSPLLLTRATTGILPTFTFCHTDIISKHALPTRRCLICNCTESQSKSFVLGSTSLLHASILADSRLLGSHLYCAWFCFGGARNTTKHLSRSSCKGKLQGKHFAGVQLDASATLTSALIVPPVHQRQPTLSSQHCYPYYHLQNYLEKQASSTVRWQLLPVQWRLERRGSH